ncbi:ribonuclease H-like domain-containing protein, partial [Tanacetum coccineum]
SLQYLTFTRPDISYAVQQVCLHMHDPREPHLSALKRILRYAGCPTTRRSTSGYCVFLGNNLLSWSAKRQLTLSRSSAEAEYRGVANAVVETCWLRNLLRELHTPLSSATLRTKHIEIDLHFVRDLVAAGEVRVLHVPSRYQFADIFTKGLPSALFEEFRSSLSVWCPPTPTAGECHWLPHNYVLELESDSHISDYNDIEASTNSEILNGVYVVDVKKNGSDDTFVRIKIALKLLCFVDEYDNELKQVFVSVAKALAQCSFRSLSLSLYVTGHWIPQNYVLDSTPIDFEFGVADVGAALAAATAASSGHWKDQILKTRCSLLIYERCNAIIFEQTTRCNPYSPIPVAVMAQVAAAHQLAKQLESGDLHWKIVSVYIHRTEEVMLKMNSKHVGSKS